MPTKRALLLVPLAIALIAAACGGGSDDNDSDDQSQRPSNATTQIAGGGSYGAQLTAIDEDIDQGFEVLSNEFNSIVDDALGGLEGVTDANELQELLEEGFAKVFNAAKDFVPRANDIIENGIERIEALDTPDQFEDDEQAFLDAIDERIDLLNDLADIADDEDIEAFLALGQSTAQDDIDAALRAAISREFAGFIAAFLDDEDDDDDDDDDSPASITRDDDGDFTITSDEGTLAIDSDEGTLTVTDDEGATTTIVTDDDDVPGELRYPGAINPNAITLEDDNVLNIILSFSTNDDPNDVLDFYEDALADIGIRGDPMRGEIGGLFSLAIGDAQQDGAGVIVAENAGPGGNHNVNVVLALPR